MRRSKQRQALALALILVLLISATAGCTALPGGPGTAMAASKSARDLSPAVPEAALGEMVAGNNAFAWDLYRSLRGGDGNLFFSPYSISAALAMTYAGARGETERQMAETLHYTLPQGELHPAFDALDLRLTPLAGDKADFKLHVVNSLWGQAGFPFREAFLDTIAVNYGAGVRLVDFTSEGKREAARQAINGWVSKETEGKIVDLLARDTLNELSRLVLVNAIYFKGEWETPFKPRSEEGEFHTLAGGTVTVPMMSRRAETPYAEGTGYQAVALPYKGGRIEMVVVLPAEGQLEAFERSLNMAQLEAILQALQPSDIKLYLPRFHYEASLELNETLAGLGMPDAFDPERADLGGIYDKEKEPRNLFIAHAVHKAFVAVDEKGTEAAAATGIVAEIVSQPTEVRVDRPFIFLIRDRETGSILFLGRVADPSQTTSVAHKDLVVARTRCFAVQGSPWRWARRIAVHDIPLAEARS